MISITPLKPQTNYILHFYVRYYCVTCFLIKHTCVYVCSGLNFKPRYCRFRLFSRNGAHFKSYDLYITAMVRANQDFRGDYVSFGIKGLGTSGLYSSGTCRKHEMLWATCLNIYHFCRVQVCKTVNIIIMNNNNLPGGALISDEVLLIKEPVVL